MRLATIDKALEAAEVAYWTGIDALGARIIAEVVKPFCDRRGCRFRSGMGGWVFALPDGRTATDGGEFGQFTVPKHVTRALSSQMLTGFPIGSYMPDYTPPSWPEKA